MVEVANLCTECYEINKPYSIVKSGKKICGICGGMVIAGQEIGDYVGQLKQELEYYRYDA